MTTIKDVLRNEVLQRGFIEITCEFKHNGKAAILINDGDRDVWIPKSLSAGFDPSTEKGACIEILVKEWFAKKEGLI